MTMRGAVLSLCVLLPSLAMAQFGQPYPGAGTGYPGGQQRPIGGSGIPFPGRKKTAAQSKQVTDTVSGKIRRISTTELILEPDDKRSITVVLEKTTLYFTSSGAGKFGDLDTGDQVSVDASRDGNNYLHAIKVTLEKKSGPVETTSDETLPDYRPATTVAPPPVPRDADDPGPPVLRRGMPAATQASTTVPPNINAAARAASREQVHGEQDHGEQPVAQRAPVARVEQSKDPVINAARETAASFTDTLPNYEVKQFTARFQTDAAHGMRTQWQALDVVSADVVAEGGKETYKNLQINGKPSKEKIENTGSWSTGEFVTVLQDMMSPATDADFFNKRSTTIVNRPAYRYDYTVEQPNSHWQVVASSQTFRPAYKGSIWIDKENSRVLRIEMSARNIPKEFPLDTVESVTEYDYVLIGATKYLLPTHSEALSCVTGSGQCSKNVIDFRNYRKFGAESNIKFDQ